MFLIKYLSFTLIAIILFSCTPVTQRSSHHIKKRERITEKAQSKKETPRSPFATQTSIPKFLICSYYGKKYHGRTTASGEVYDMYKMTAAHKTLPFGTKIRLENKETGKSIIVKVNDRGPFIDGRDLDISYGAMKKLGLLDRGVVELKALIMDQ